MARILVVDDNLMMRSVMRLALSRAGHDVILAEHGAKALVEVDRNGPFDLIITDLEMPQLDGRGLVHALKTASCPSPVLLMSGRFGLHELARVADDAGLRVHDTIEKPFTGERLLATVDRLIGQGDRRVGESRRRADLEAAAPV
jgi:DNA-binding NtrC family response regulator